MKWKTLSPSTLDKLIDQKKPIYVLNTSAMPSGDKGMIVINFYDGTRREFFKMPPTFIPMAVTDVIPAERLRDSRDFRQTLQKGMLTLVDAEQAEDYLQTADAKEEYEALVLSEHSAKARNVDVENEVSRRLSVSHTSAAGGSGPMQEVEAVDTVSNKVRGLVEDMVAGNLTGKDVLMELRRHQSALKPVDLTFVMANTHDKDLVEWSKRALASVGGDDGTHRTAKAAVGKKIVTKPVGKRKEAASFDFDESRPVEMTPEEVRADELARAKATANQNLSGASSIDDQINTLIKAPR